MITDVRPHEKHHFPGLRTEIEIYWWKIPLIAWVSTQKQTYLQRSGFYMRESFDTDEQFTRGPTRTTRWVFSILTCDPPIICNNFTVDTRVCHRGWATAAVPVLRQVRIASWWNAAVLLQNSCNTSIVLNRPRNSETASRDTVRWLVLTPICVPSSVPSSVRTHTDRLLFICV